MQNKTLMVREYTNQQDFHADEQKLSREGWMLEPAVNAERQPGWLERLRARFTRRHPAAPIVVAYSRQRFS